MSKHVKANHKKSANMLNNHKSSVLLPYIPSGKYPKEDDGDDGDGRIFPGHPSPILNAPRDNISRKGIPHSDHYLGAYPWTYRDSTPAIKGLNALHVGNNES